MKKIQFFKLTRVPAFHTLTRKTTIFLYDIIIHIEYNISYNF
jgi:hypothetical protein